MQADPTLQSWDMRTPLHVAAQHRQPAVIREILLDPQVRRQVAAHSHQSLHPLANKHTLSDDPSSGIETPTSSSHLHMQHQLPTAVADSEATHPAQRAKHTQHAQHPQHALHSQHAQHTQHQLPTASNDTSHPHSAQHAQHEQATGVSGQLEHMAPADSDNQAEQDQMQAAVSSLQSLRSAHLDAFMAARADQAAALEPNAMQKTDSASAVDDMAEAGSDSGFSNDDADALDALLSLTADCSVQSPNKRGSHVQRKVGSYSGKIAHECLY